MSSGTIEWVGSVKCFTCPAIEIGIPHARGRAHLAGLGWRMLSHRWHCAACVKDIEGGSR